MRSLSAALLACGLAAAPLSAANPPARLTDDAIFASDSSGQQPRDMAWSKDGRRLAYLWGEDEEAVLQALDPATGRSEVLLRLADLALDEFQ